MTLNNSDIIAMFDRVLRIEPQLRTSLAAMRETADHAIHDVWVNYSWAADARIQDDPDYQVWTAVHAAYRVFSQQFDSVVANIAENLRNQANLTSDVEDSERRELSMELYQQHRELTMQLKELVRQRDIDAATVDAANLSCARVLRSKVASLKNPRLKQIAKSAVDTATAATLLARRLAVVNDHPPTMGDAVLQ